MTILHDTIRVLKLLIVEYINVHTPTITAIVLLPCHSMGGVVDATYVALHQGSQKMRVGCNLPMICQYSNSVRTPIMYTPSFPFSNAKTSIQGR